MRAKLDALKQAGSVQSYNVSFDRLTMQIPSLDGEEIIYRYLAGLKAPLREKLMTNRDNISSLTILKQAAMRLDASTFNPKFKDVNEVEAHQSTILGRKNKKFIKEGSSKRSKDGRRGPCFICDKEGHWARSCPNLQDVKGRNKAKMNDSKNQDRKSDDTSVEAHIALSTRRDSPYSITLDSGATDHMVKDRFLLENYKPTTSKTITGVNPNDGEPLQSIGTGTVTIFNNNEEVEPLVLKNVLYVPGLTRNLCSTHPLLHAGYNVSLTKNTGNISLNKRTIAKVIHHNRLPFIDGYTTTTPAAFTTSTSEN
jgi:hypothetical protein